MTDDLLDEATRLADYIGAHEDWEPAHVANTDAATVRALIERVQQAEAERDSLRSIATGEVAAHETQVARIAAERDAARGKLDKVRDLAAQWDEEASDYVPPLPADLPYNLMRDHSRDVLAILDGK